MNIIHCIVIVYVLPIEHSCSLKVWLYVHFLRLEPSPHENNLGKHVRIVAEKMYDSTRKGLSKEHNLSIQPVCFTSILYHILVYYTIICDRSQVCFKIYSNSTVSTKISRSIPVSILNPP